MCRRSRSRLRSRISRSSRGVGGAVRAVVVGVVVVGVVVVTGIGVVTVEVGERVVIKVTVEVRLI